MPNRKLFTGLFLLLIIMECIALSTDKMSAFRFLTKPALLSSLIVYLALHTKMPSKLKRSLLGALSFSLAGDVILMNTDKGEGYFIFGLLAFLIAHIFYIAAFFRTKFVSLKRLLIISAILLCYASSLFVIMVDGMGAMLPYVVSYIIVILLMVKTMVFRQGYVNPKSAQEGILGAVLFLISDSLLALDKFAFEVPYAPVLIMITYGFAQFFMVHAGTDQKIDMKNIRTFFQTKLEPNS